MKTAVATRREAGNYTVRFWDGTLLHRYNLRRMRGGRWALYEGPAFVGIYSSKRRCLAWLESQA